MVPRKVRKAVAQNTSEIAVYVLFGMSSIPAAMTLTSLKLSACLSLSAGLQCLGCVLLLLQVRKTEAIENVSLRTLILYACALSSRLFATLQYRGYQPTDVSGTNGLYHTLECAELVLVLVSIAVVTQKQAWLEDSKDTCNIWVILALCVGLACTTHSELNQEWLGDVSWILGLYLETLAMVPQLWLLQRSGAAVESLHKHFIASTFVSRAILVYFWSICYVELAPKSSDVNVPGLMVMLAQLLQLVIYLDFMYLYVKSIRENSRLLIPATFCV